MFQCNVDRQLVDYDKWFQASFGKDLKNILSEHNITPIRILRDDEDPNHCIVILEASTQEAFEKGRLDPRIQAINTDTSLVKSSSHTIYTSTNLKEVPVGSGEYRYGFHVDHKLVNYDRWFAMFAEGSLRGELEKEHGLTALRVLRSVINPNEAVVVFTGNSQEAMDALHNDPRVQDRFSDKEIFAETPILFGRFIPEIL